MNNPTDANSELKVWVASFIYRGNGQVFSNHQMNVVDAALSTGKAKELYSFIHQQLEAKVAESADAAIDKAMELVLLNSFTVKDTSYGRIPRRRLVADTVATNKALMGLKPHLTNNKTTSHEQEESI